MPASEIHRKMRRCENCGHQALNRYTSHKVWRGGRMVYCGYMRVVRDEE